MSNHDEPNEQAGENMGTSWLSRPVGIARGWRAAIVFAPALAIALLAWWLLGTGLGGDIASLLASAAWVLASGYFFVRRDGRA